MIQTAQPVENAPKPPTSKPRKKPVANKGPAAVKKKKTIPEKAAAETRPRKPAVSKTPRFQLDSDSDTDYENIDSEIKSLAVYRTLRRRMLTQQTYLERQISRGRPDTRKSWCGQEYCFSEKVIFDVPFLWFTDKELSDEELPVEDYHRDFATAMVDTLFPDLASNFAARAAKLRAVWSFVDSPPTRSSFWRCKKLCRDNRIWTNPEDLQAALMEVEPVFRDAMFGARTKERVALVHEHLDVSEEAWEQPRDLRFALLQFLFRAELFRRHETRRSPAWEMGSPDRVSQFLAALAFHYWTMVWEGCFGEQGSVLDEEWDYAWDQWLEKFPASSMKLAGGDFVVRDEHEGSEEDFLEKVGYLGGIGRCEELHRPTRRWKKRR